MALLGSRAKEGWLNRWMCGAYPCGIISFVPGAILLGSLIVLALAATICRHLLDEPRYCWEIVERFSPLRTMWNRVVLIGSLVS